MRYRTGLDPAPLTPDQADKLRGQIARPLRWADGLCAVLRAMGRGGDDDPLYREAVRVAAALRDLDAAVTADAARLDHAAVNPPSAP